MFRTFLGGLVLGIAAAIGVAGWLPLAQPERVASITRVAPNGGRQETFHINLPDDRLLLTADRSSAIATMPEDLYLPDAPELSGVRAEMFRLRDTDERVVGVASRLSDASGTTRDWTLYLPARGALFLSEEPGGTDEASHAGRILAGSESMQNDIGFYHERRIAIVSETESETRSQIEIATVIESIDE